MRDPRRSRVSTWLALLAALVVIFIIGVALIDTVCHDQQGLLLRRLTLVTRTLTAAWKRSKLP